MDFDRRIALAMSLYAQGETLDACAAQAGVCRSAIQVRAKLPENHRWLHRGRSRLALFFASMDYLSGTRITAAARDNGVNQLQLRHAIRLHGHTVRPSPTSVRWDYDRSYFREIDCEEKAYFLGFLAADGHVSKSAVYLTVSTKDESVIERLSSAIGRRSLRRTINAHGGPIVRISYHSVEMARDLLRHGLRHDKTYTLTWDDATANIPPPLLRHFIRGYWDGDGHWSMSKPMARASRHVGLTGADAFLRGVSANLSAVLDIPQPKIRPRGMNPPLKPDPTYARLEYGSLVAIDRIHHHLYCQSTIHLPRKKAMADAVVNDVRRRTPTQTGCEKCN